MPYPPKEKFEEYSKIFYEEFELALSNANLELKEDLVKIAFFLQDVDKIYEGLGELEEKLSENMDKKKIYSSFFLTSSDNKCHKILSDVLKEWGNVFFKEIIKTSNFLPDNDFLKNLNRRIMVKDIGSGIRHGEWSHFIQWYLIAHNKALIDSLNYPLDYIYMQLGETSQNILNKAMTLWDIIFDYFPNDEDEKASTEEEEEEEEEIININKSLLNDIVNDGYFRSPENITSDITEYMFTDFPILSKCILNRINKRTLLTEKPAYKVKL